MLRGQALSQISRRLTGSPDTRFGPSKSPQSRQRPVKFGQVAKLDVAASWARLTAAAKSQATRAARALLVRGC